MNPIDVQMNIHPEVFAFFDEASNTISYVLKDPETNAYAIIDPVLDVDYAKGLIPETQHFRNILRYEVLTGDSSVTIRVDESLYFANAPYLESYLYDRVAPCPEIRHLVLMCSAVNEIDISALESLSAINAHLKEINIKLHLSEVKGPVMDKLSGSHFLNELSGQVFMSQFDAVESLTPKITRLN